MPLTRTRVEFLCNAIALSLCQIFQVHAFREVLADQTIGVFIRAALPGVMRCGEVESGTSGLFDLWILMKLGTVIRGNGFELCDFTIEQLDATPIEGSRRPIF